MYQFACMLTMSLKEAEEYMTTPNRRGDYPEFSIEFVTADKTRNKGGEIRVIQRAQMYRVGKSRAQHWKHSTRNLLDIEQNKIVTVHRDLILMVDNKLIRP
jgi:hypothetical protein